MARVVRSRSFPARGVSIRRRTGWSLGPNGETAARAVAGRDLFPVGAQANQDGLTLVRLRGTLDIRLNSVASAGDGFAQIACGICNVNENAFGIGITGVPDPISDIGWDGWLWYWTGSMITSFGTLTNAEGSNSRSIVIDSKAMRKTLETDVVVGVFSVLSEAGTAVIQAIMNTRILDKLP